MKTFFHSVKSLSSPEIFNLLKKLRNHAVAPYSHYHVAALVEIKLNEHLYFYTSGVNIENDEHNRLSIHSEQNAIANAITLLGGHTKFSKIWIMAAPANATPEEKQKAGKSCGHCRQIMMSLAEANAEIYVVSLDGQFALPDSFEKHFLPDGFSERDLNFSVIDSSYTNSISDSDFFNSPRLQVWELIDQPPHLIADQIAKYLRILSPHIINKHFQTSTITACIIKCGNGGYAAGVLIQDIAFLTTDAIFVAIGNAVTQFGNQHLRFDEIYLASTALDPAQLSLAELEALGHYVHEQTLVHFYTPDEQHVSYTFQECLNARADKIRDQLLENKFLLQKT